MIKRNYVKTESEQTSKWTAIKTAALALVVVSLHVVAIGCFFTIQGCGTVRSDPKFVEPPAAPVMPPRVTSTRTTKAPPLPPMRPPRPAPPAPSADTGSLETYVVQSGDSLSKIAARHGISVKELAEVNGISNLNVVRIGQKLKLPPQAVLKAPAKTGTAKPAPAPDKKKPASSASPVLAAGEYMVQSGDSLSRIASRNGTTVSALRELNKLTTDKIVIGQKLKLPGAAPAATASTTAKPAPSATPQKPSESAPAAPVQPALPEEPIVKSETPSAPPEPRAIAAPAVELTQTADYKVIEGDTMESVAMFFQLTREELAGANGMGVDDPLIPGQTIKIPYP